MQDSIKSRSSTRQLRFPRPLPALWEALYQHIRGNEAQAAASQRIELPPHKLREARLRSRQYLMLGGMGGARASFQGRRIVVGRSAEEDPVVAFNWCGRFSQAGSILGSLRLRETLLRLV